MNETIYKKKTLTTCTTELDQLVVRHIASYCHHRLIHFSYYYFNKFYNDQHRNTNTTLLTRLLTYTHNNTLNHFQLITNISFNTCNTVCLHQ